MKPESTPRLVDLTASINACIANGERLIDETYWFDYQEPYSSKLVLSFIAQEEFSKAFLLFLVREGVVPWTKYILRATNDHACKHLVGVVIEYLDPKWETNEELEAWAKNEVSLGARLPADVGTAIDMLRYEKIGTWERTHWGWDTRPDYDPTVERIAEGKRDRIKQDALYVRIGRDGRIVSTPAQVKSEVVDIEYERAQRYGSLVKRVIGGKEMDLSMYEKVRASFSLLFQRPNMDRD